MKKRAIMLPMLCLTLAVSAARASGEANVGEIDQCGDSIVRKAEVGKITYEEFQKLKDEVSYLKESLDNEDDSSQSLGFGGMIISLFFGALGGFGAFYVINSKNKNWNIGKEEPVSVNPRAQAHKTPDLNTTAVNQQTYIHNQHTQSNSQSAVQNQQNHQSNLNQQDYNIQQSQLNNDRNEVNETKYDQYKKPVADKQLEVKPNKQVLKPDSVRTAFGNIMILSANQLIIEDNELSDTPMGLPFRFDINEARNTATYTFTPDILSSMINNLTTYEQFVEPFDYNPRAKNVTVLQPGTLRHMQGYWQIEKKITISIN